jgi:hypothetical protein
MQAIEFEATSHNHLIRIHDTVPDGVAIRVLLLVDDNVMLQNENTGLKTLKPCCRGVKRQ